MSLTRNYKETVLNRLRDDEEMRLGTLNEALQAFVSGDIELGKELLKDLINATVGFEQLAVMVQKNSKSLHRMFSPKGNPTVLNFFVILSALISRLGGKFEIKIS